MSNDEPNTPVGDDGFPTPRLFAIRNTIREPGRTCEVCAAPVDGYDMCYCCHRRRHLHGLADVVAPFVYAVAGDASARHLSGYKNCLQRLDRDRHAEVVAALLSDGLRHEPCFVAAVGIPIAAYAAIPSLTSRPGRHPLIAIAAALRPVDEQLLAATLDSPCDRTIRLDKFAVGRPEAVRGRHVALIDDVWTTGANAQSAALTLRRAGAAAVSVLTVGRWLDPRHPPTRDFVVQREWASYDPLQCPINVQRCRLSKKRALTA